MGVTEMAIRLGRRFLLISTLGLTVQTLAWTSDSRSSTPCVLSPDRTHNGSVLVACQISDGEEPVSLTRSIRPAVSQAPLELRWIRLDRSRIPFMTLWGRTFHP
jgi:hypothetical protein